MSSFLTLRIRPWGLLGALGGLAAAGTVAGFAASLGWIFDVAVNFRVQYFVVLALLSIAFLFGRRYRTACGFGTLALVNLAMIVPLYYGVGPAAPTRARAILLNVHTENRRFDLVREFIQREKPDFVVFEEVNDEWLAELSKLANDYPHILPAPRPDNFGIALFSRWPLRDAEIREISDTDVPSLLARVNIGDKSLTIIGTHPLPPGSRETFALRNRHLIALSKLAQTRTGPWMVLGDLNTTPWSPYFQQLLVTSDLRDVARGRGLNASWPVPIYPMRIPIDHCLVSREIGIANLRVGPSVGSDHFPIIVDFSL